MARKKLKTAAYAASSAEAPDERLSAMPEKPKHGFVLFDTRHAEETACTPELSSSTPDSISIETDASVQQLSSAAS